MADKSDGDDKKKGDEEAGGGRKKLILIIAPVVLVVVLAAVYFLVLKPSGSADAAGGAGAAAAASPTPSYVEGAVIKLDPISINLANGHFLKLGMSLQASASAGEAVDGAKAMDAAIELFSQKSMDELATRDGREKAKVKLEKRLQDLYEQKVYEVYFTEFVMQ